MSITHDWSINSVLKFLDNGGTVYRVFFELYSYDEENPSTLQIKTLSFVDLDIHHIDNFIPFDELTKSQVLQWVFDRLVKYQIVNVDSDETKYEYEIYHEKYIENIKNPTSLTPELPNTVIGYINESPPSELITEQNSEDSSFAPQIQSDPISESSLS